MCFVFFLYEYKERFHCPIFFFSRFTVLFLDFYIFALLKSGNKIGMHWVSGMVFESCKKEEKIKKEHSVSFVIVSLVE